MTTNTRTRAGAESARHDARPFPSGGTALVAWLVVFAGYAAVVSIVTEGPSSDWGACAAVGYAAATLAACRVLRLPCRATWMARPNQVGVERSRRWLVVGHQAADQSGAPKPEH